MLDRTSSPSPSPSRKPCPLPASALSPGGAFGARLLIDDGDDDDEDEETLQLKLQEIQARLRLKKLQNAARNKENYDLHQRSGEEHPRPRPPASTNMPRQLAHRATPAADDALRPALRNQVVQVPASPVSKAQVPQPQTSPSKVRLGIDKGLRAKDVSLKRAPSHKGAQPGYLERSRSSNASSALPGEPAPKPQTKSFSERLASARTKEASRTQRQERIQKLRTSAFGIGKQEMDEYKKSAVDIPDEPLQVPTFTREQVLSGQLPRSKTAPSIHLQAQDDPDEDPSSFEPYSCFHLSRRILPHRVLARHVSGKKVLSLKELLRDVKSPDYSLPDVEQDIVVLAIVASKSEPRAHKPAASRNGLQAEERGKYMVVTLADLELELDLFLFDMGFARFWKLTEGTVVAILNPGVMPPPPGRQDTGRFGLVNSDADMILEIGTARDLGYCQSIKDGDGCGAWVNKKRTHFCEFHSNEAVRKQRSTRMEVNAAGFGVGRERHQGKGKGKGGGNGDGNKKGPDNYDWETKTRWFASRSFSAADLIDGKDRAPADRRDKSGFVKRSIEVKEREREIMKRLGRVGTAAGREYMQRTAKNSSHSQASSTASQAPIRGDDSGRVTTGPGSATLGLLQKGRDRTIHLSPVKRKRPDSSQTSSTAGGAKPSAYGWGSNLRDKLSSLKEGQPLHQGVGGRSPVRKKTRFVTDKGIREAGRESLGNELSDKRQAALGRGSASAGAGNDIDDELVIVK